MTNCIVLPGYFQGILRWVSRDFHLMGRFHVHPAGQAHKGHKSCAVPFIDCSHPGDDEKMEGLDILNLVMGSAMMGCNLCDSD
ncbi:hypothetical protein EAF00_003538 [Botryotinia globosa]|nr:hypothetical protein EAF00_003538 [Botryotinia globosa]